MAEKKYIEVDVALTSLDELEKTSHHNSVLWPDHVEKCREALRALPAANVRPAVRGKWILKEDGRAHCSMCNAPGNSRVWNFCPNCGAMMRKS